MTSSVLRSSPWSSRWLGLRGRLCGRRFSRRVLGPSVAQSGSAAGLTMSVPLGGPSQRPSRVRVVWAAVRAVGGGPRGHAGWSASAAGGWVPWAIVVLGSEGGMRNSRRGGRSLSSPGSAVGQALRSLAGSTSAAFVSADDDASERLAPLGDALSAVGSVFRSALVLGGRLAIRSATQSRWYSLRLGAWLRSTRLTSIPRYSADAGGGSWESSLTRRSSLIVSCFAEHVHHGSHLSTRSHFPIRSVAWLSRDAPPLIARCMALQTESARIPSSRHPSFLCHFSSPLLAHLCGVFPDPHLRRPFGRPVRSSGTFQSVISRIAAPSLRLWLTTSSVGEST